MVGENVFDNDREKMLDNGRFRYYNVAIVALDNVQIKCLR